MIQSLNSVLNEHFQNKIYLHSYFHSTVCICSENMVFFCYKRGTNSYKQTSMFCKGRSLSYLHKLFYDSRLIRLIGRINNLPVDRWITCDCLPDKGIQML